MVMRALEMNDKQVTKASSFDIMHAVGYHDIDLCRIEEAIGSDVPM